MIPRIIKLSFATLLFYAAGLAYEHFYQITIYTVKSFSSVPLKFHGKFPFLFFGDPAFGLIIATIPLIIFLAHKLVASSTTSLVKTSGVYAMYFISTYLVACWVTSIGLIASNDFYKEGQELSYHVRQVNLNQIYLTAVVVSTVLAAATLVATKLIVRHKSKPSSFQA